MKDVRPSDPKISTNGRTAKAKAQPRKPAPEPPPAPTEADFLRALRRLRAAQDANERVRTELFVHPGGEPGYGEIEQAFSEAYDTLSKRQQEMLDLLASADCSGKVVGGMAILAVDADMVPFPEACDVPPYDWPTIVVTFPLQELGDLILRPEQTPMRKTMEAALRLDETRN